MAYEQESFRDARPDVGRAPHHQYRQHRDVAELVCHATVKYVRKAAMPVCRHRNEIAVLSSGGCRYLRGRVPARQNCLYLKSVGLERIGNRLDVLTVALHLFGFAEVELTNVACGPAVGD